MFVIIMIHMKKILMFNNYYLPAKRYGGPVTSLATIIDNLGDEYEFLVIAANHEFGETRPFEGIKEGWNEVGKAKVKYINLKEIYWNGTNVRQLITENHPDLVWCSGILVPSDKWFIAKECRILSIPFLISPRGEVCSNAFHTKYLKKAVVAFIARTLGVYRKAYFHAASELEKAGLMKFYGADEDRIFLVPNIPGLLHAAEHKIEKKENTLRIVFLSRIQDTKNLLLAIEAANLLTGDVIFDIYGPKESEEYWNLCKAAMDRAPSNVKINYVGIVNPEDVRSVFSKYHCFLFPTITENFGHAIAEALSVSVPVIIGRGATPWDDINEKAGYVCQPGSKESFAEALRNIEKMNNEEYSLFVGSTKEYYDSKSDDNNAIEKHREMIEQCMNRKV